MARQRNKGRPLRQGNFSIYFLVDGECEQDYLSSIKTVEPFKTTLDSQRIKFAPDIPKTKSLDAQYNAVCDALNNYDKVFWIVDYDVIKNETLTQRRTSRETSSKKFYRLSQKFKDLLSFKKYEGKEAYVLINNPSIEFWYLLHYENTTKFYTTSEGVESRLKNYLSNYTKNDKQFRKSIFILLQDKLNTAITNAQYLVEEDSNIQARADIYKIFKDNFKILQRPEKSQT